MTSKEVELLLHQLLGYFQTLVSHHIPCCWWCKVGCTPESVVIKNKRIKRINL